LSQQHNIIKEIKENGRDMRSKSQHIFHKLKQKLPIDSRILLELLELMVQRFIQVLVRPPYPLDKLHKPEHLSTARNAPHDSIAHRYDFQTVAGDSLVLERD